MNTFQLIGITGCLLMAFISLRKLIQSRGGLWSQLFWVFIWASGGVAIFYPDITRQLAQLLGITRGADLVSYATTLTLLAYLFRSQIKQQQLEQQLTEIVRHVALVEGRIDSHNQTEINSGRSS